MEYLVVKFEKDMPEEELQGWMNGAAEDGWMIAATLSSGASDTLIFFRILLDEELEGADGTA